MGGGEVRGFEGVSVTMVGRRRDLWVLNSLQWLTGYSRLTLVFM